MLPLTGLADQIDVIVESLTETVADQLEDEPHQHWSDVVNAQADSLNIDAEGQGERTPRR
jgi:hypothetical protein